MSCTKADVDEGTVVDVTGGGDHFRLCSPPQFQDGKARPISLRNRSLDLIHAFLHYVS